jgi:hypothetical protein
MDDTALRDLIGSILVHPTGATGEIAFIVTGQLARLIGGQAFPSLKISAQIKDAETGQPVAVSGQAAEVALILEAGKSGGIGRMQLHDRLRSGARLVEGKVERRPFGGRISQNALHSQGELGQSRDVEEAKAEIGLAGKTGRTTAIEGSNASRSASLTGPMWPSEEAPRPSGQNARAPPARASPGNGRESERRALRVNEFCQCYGLSRATAYKLMKVGKLRTVLVCGRRLVPVDAAEALIWE